MEILASTNYPFLNIFWTMLIFFCWVIWIWIAITVFVDLFRRHDMSGWVKALWVIFVIILPFLGVLIYLIAYSKGMAERNAKHVQAAQAQMDQYVRATAAAGDPAAQIAKAKELLDQGVIDQTEFNALKAKALA